MNAEMGVLIDHLKSYDFLATLLFFFLLTFLLPHFTFTEIGSGTLTFTAWDELLFLVVKWLALYIVSVTTKNLCRTRGSI